MYAEPPNENRYESGRETIILYLIRELIYIFTL